MGVGPSLRHPCRLDLDVARRPGPRRTRCCVPPAPGTRSSNRGGRYRRHAALGGADPVADPRSERCGPSYRSPAICVECPGRSGSEPPRWRRARQSSAADSAWSPRSWPLTRRAVLARSVRWRAFPVEAAPPDHIDVREAQQALAEAIRDSARALLAADVSGASGRSGRPWRTPPGR